jgi:hypothetical protein
VLAVLIAVLAVRDFEPRAGWEKIEAIHRRYADFSADVSGRVAPDARLASLIGWHYSVFLDRPVYSFYFAVYRKQSMQGVQDVIEKYGIDTVVLAGMSPSDMDMSEYFGQRYAVEETGKGLIVRIRR